MLGNPFVEEQPVSTWTYMATVSVKKIGTGFLLEYGDVRLALDTGIKLASPVPKSNVAAVPKPRPVVSAPVNTFVPWPEIYFGL